VDKRMEASKILGQMRVFNQGTVALLEELYELLVDEGTYQVPKAVTSGTSEAGRPKGPKGTESSR